MSIPEVEPHGVEAGVRCAVSGQDDTRCGGGGLPCARCSVVISVSTTSTCNEQRIYCMCDTCLGVEGNFHQLVKLRVW